MPAPRSLGPDALAVRNGKYYFDDELTIFLVEGQLFKVHRHFLKKESGVLQWMFMCPLPKNEDPEGTTDDRPIPLPDVKAKEFECLLDFFYEDSSSRTFSQQQWIDLLSISTRLDFIRIRDIAIEQLYSDFTLDPTAMILLAEKYDIPHWLHETYAAIR